MEQVFDQSLLTSVRTHAGCPVPESALEVVWKESEKVFKQRGTPLEFVLAEQIKALWAEANQRQFNAAGKPVDFEAFCKAKLAKSDSLFSKLLGKSKAQQAVAEAEAIEAEITASRAGLKASEQRVAELKNDIEATEAELSNHDESAVEESIQEAAKIWKARHRSPYNASKVDAAIAYAVESEVVNRILNARLIYLRDSLTKEQEKVSYFQSELKNLEKQL
jgi:hypothetical protein